MPSGFCLAAFSIPASAAAFRFAFPGQNDIQQQRRDSRIGEVGRDTRPHGPRAQHGHSLDRLHTGSLPRTGLSAELAYGETS